MRLHSDTPDGNRRSPAPVAILYLLALSLVLAGCVAGAQYRSRAATLEPTTQSPTAVGTPLPNDPVVVAAGDIACDPTSAS
jgi:hypothetical protein